jgi:hypothetical protein
VARINTMDQVNLWGKQADTGGGLEPQRTDLYYVDFSTALGGVQTASNVDPKLAPIIPQYVRSISFPEIRTKSEPIRRDSVPYPMPSWDDPLDAIKIVFLLDTHENERTRSAVTRFLDTWLALTRAGRGSREGGYMYPRGWGWLKLNSEYRMDFTFDVSLHLLRGLDITKTGFVNDGSDAAAFAAFMAQSTSALRSQVTANTLTQSGIPGLAAAGSALALSNAVQKQAFISQFEIGSAGLVSHSQFTLTSAWLAAYKLSDFSYTESSLVTVEATFYVDSLTTDLPQQGFAPPSS